VWVNRQLPLTGYEHISGKQRAKLDATLAAEDWTNEVGAAHAVKERLRMLLAESDPDLIRRRLCQFYDAKADSHMNETTRLAMHDRALVASHPHRLDPGPDQRPDRGLQPDHQADQARRLRLPQHRQLPTAHTQPHRLHPRTRSSGDHLNGLGVQRGRGR
jgi:hypothetical protein